MKIQISKVQYLRLLKLVYLGNWMINAIRSGQKGDEMIEEYDELEQYIFSHAEKFGIGKYIHFDKELGKYYPTHNFEFHTDIEKYRSEYNEDIFWEEVVHRLAERDLLKTYTLEELQHMDMETYWQNIEPFERKYNDEMEMSGVDRLVIDVTKDNKRMVN